MKEWGDKPAFILRQSISEDLVVYIKQQILSGRLNPGDRIVETKLARELGVSQTPVREALRQLQGEGIITIVPNKGPMVCDFTVDDVFEIYSIRCVLEGLAIRLATQRATDEEIAELEQFYERMVRKLEDDSVDSLLNDAAHIHESIIQLSRHERIMATYKTIAFHVQLANRLLGTKITKQNEVDEHRELIEALKGRDPDHAEQTIRRHIYRAYCNFIALNGIEADAENLSEQAWF